MTVRESLNCSGGSKVIYNRIGSYGNSINDFGDHVESIYRSIISMPAVAKIDADIYFTDESRSEINVETTSEFALNNKVPYRISLVLIENGVGLRHSR